MFETDALTSVYASALAGVPAEVLSQQFNDNCLPRLRAHLADLKGGAAPMRDAKMLVLGNGRVGKTQLVRTLFDQGYDERVGSTHGITVRPFDLKETPDGEPARLWIWDFGGQDIYHSTHTLFMKSRGIYLLGWTPAHENNGTHEVDGHSFRNSKLPYWLTQIGAFAGTDIPLIVTQTQADKLKDRSAIPEYARKSFESFPAAVDLHHSARTGRGQRISRKRRTTDAYTSIEQPMVGTVRLKVKPALEDMILSGETRTLSIDAFG